MFEISDGLPQLRLHGGQIHGVTDKIHAEGIDIPNAVASPFNLRRTRCPHVFCWLFRIQGVVGV